MELSVIKDLLEAARNDGQEIVVVIGLGFVGTAVSANLARTRINGKTTFFVIGLDQNTPDGQEKCGRLNRGIAPTYANDESLEEVIHSCWANRKNLIGSTDSEVLQYADTVVFCINLDLKREPFQTEELSIPIEGYAAAMRMVGEKIPVGTLVTVESTLPIGMCDQVLYPALCEGQQKQGIDTVKNAPLLAFCYERVMPGPEYLDSVNNFWRSYAGMNEESNRRAEAFLSKYVNTAEFPLWKHKSTRAAEMSKLLENSYRATNIAFIEEWAKVAENAGVDLFDVIQSIRLRKGTHDNMMLPGLGVGGYCLTKDALLAAFGAEKILGIKAELPFSRKAILTNEKMPLRAIEWIKNHFDGNLQGRKALLVGVTYRPGVADTRTSATESVARELLNQGASVEAYDPLITTWEELPEVPVFADFADSIDHHDIVVICLPDKDYRGKIGNILVDRLSQEAIVVDPWNMLGNQSVEKMTQRGIEVRVYGRGDLPTGREH